MSAKIAMALGFALSAAASEAAAGFDPWASATYAHIAKLLLETGDPIEAMEGKPWRKLKIYLYCNPLTAAHMIDYAEAFSAFLPCRVALVEDKTGKLWIYTLNMDMMIYGGKPLPPALADEALKVKKIMQAILQRGANGEF